MEVKEMVKMKILSRYEATNIHGYIDIYDRIEEKYIGYHFAYYDMSKARELSQRLDEKYREKEMSL